MFSSPILSVAYSLNVRELLVLISLFRLGRVNQTMSAMSVEEEMKEDLILSYLRGEKPSAHVVSMLGIQVKAVGLHLASAEKITFAFQYFKPPLTLVNKLARQYEAFDVIGNFLTFKMNVASFTYKGDDKGCMCNDPSYIARLLQEEWKLMSKVQVLKVLSFLPKEQAKALVGEW